MIQKIEKENDSITIEHVANSILDNGLHSILLS